MKEEALAKEGLSCFLFPIFLLFSNSGTDIYERSLRANIKNNSELLCKTLWWFFKILKIELLFISLQGIALKEIEARSQGDVCTSIFIAVLFTVAKIQKQHKCPSTIYQYVCNIYTY